MAETVKTKPQETVKKPEVKAETEAQKDLFKQEVYFQSYRIENIIKTLDEKAYEDLKTKSPALMADPFLIRFFNAHKTRTMNIFVGEALQKTASEREQLLEKIRKVIHDAKSKQPEKPEETKQQEQTIKEEKEFTDLMQKKELSDTELDKIDSEVSKPMDITSGKVDVQKIQQQYKIIMAAQKAMGLHAMAMQNKYQEAIGLQKKLDSKKGWVRRQVRSYLGVVDWLGRKVASGARMVGIVKSKSDADELNAQLDPIKKFFNQRFEKIKRLKFFIDARGKEVKDGLGVFKGDMRQKLKELISREDWTKAEEIVREKNQKLLEDKKKEFQKTIDKTRTEGQKIESAKTGVTALNQNLQTKLLHIEGGENDLNKRAEQVEERVKELENIYGDKDPRVVAMKKEVLFPLQEGQNIMSRVRNGTILQLTDAQQKNQKLDILKADMYMGGTMGIAELTKINLAIKHGAERIETIKGKRAQLHGVLEKVETAYVTVDQFKDNVTKNLDKFTEGNNKFYDAITKQNAHVQQMKIKDIGIGTAIIKNTWPINWVGTAIDYGLFRLPGYIIGGFQAIYYKGIKKDKDWSYMKATERWSFTGMLSRGVGALSNGYDKHWLKKDGFYGAVKPKNWFTKGLCSVGNFASGAVGSVLGLANGVAYLLYQPTMTFDSIGEVLSDWGKFKHLLSEAIHLGEFKAGRHSIGAGKVGGDLAIMFFTAGAGSGASSAAKAASVAGKWARPFGYAYGFSKEILRQTIHIPQHLGRMFLNMGRWGKDWTYGWMKAGAGNRSPLVYKHSVLAESRLTRAAEQFEKVFKGNGEALLKKLPVKSPLRDILQKIKNNDGLTKILQNVGKPGGMSVKEFKEFIKSTNKALKNEMFNSRWGRRGKIENLAREFQRFTRAYGARELGRRYLIERGLIENVEATQIAAELVEATQIAAELVEATRKVAVLKEEIKQNIATKREYKNELKQEKAKPKAEQNPELVQKLKEIVQMLEEGMKIFSVPEISILEKKLIRSGLKEIKNRLKEIKNPTLEIQDLIKNLEPLLLELFSKAKLKPKNVWDFWTVSKNKPVYINLLEQGQIRKAIKVYNNSLLAPMGRELTRISNLSFYSYVRRVFKGVAIFAANPLEKMYEDAQEEHDLEIKEKRNILTVKEKQRLEELRSVKELNPMDFPEEVTPLSKQEFNKISDQFTKDLNEAAIEELKRKK